MVVNVFLVYSTNSSDRKDFIESITQLPASAFWFQFVILVQAWTLDDLGYGLHQLFDNVSKTTDAMRTLIRSTNP